MRPESATRGFRTALLRRLWGVGRPMLVPLVLAIALLGTVLWLGRRTRESVRDSDRYSLSFAEIDCPAPPGRDRGHFLAEVRYVAEEPERLRLLDDDLAKRLARAFARHPWVERVERVTVQPSRQVRVELSFRVPVLAVMLGPGDEATLTAVVDQRAVRLPAEAFSTDLPRLIHEGDPPGGAGTRWLDPNVESAARTAAFLHPHQARLRIATIQVSAKGLILKTHDGSTIRWGHPPESEKPDEPPASQKLARLLQGAEGDRLAPGVEYDLRLPEAGPP